MGVKLAVFDLDGTLIRGDTVCVAISRALGKYERMLGLEGYRNDDEVVLARQEMTQWYLDAGEDVVIRSLESLRLAPGAEEGIRTLRENGIESTIVSMTWQMGIATVANWLQIPRHIGSDLDFETGGITHIFGHDKGPIVRAEMESRGLGPNEVAVVGDSSGDYSMLEEVAHRYYVGASPPAIKKCHHMPGADIRDIARSIIETR